MLYCLYVQYFNYFDEVHAMKLIPLSQSNSVLRFFSSCVAAGFPSPADDYVEKGLSLDELLIQHPSATYLVRAEGDSMLGSGIFNNDILMFCVKSVRSTSNFSPRQADSIF